MILFLTATKISADLNFVFAKNEQQKLILKQLSCQQKFGFQNFQKVILQLTYNNTCPTSPASLSTHMYTYYEFARVDALVCCYSFSNDFTQPFKQTDCIRVLESFMLNKRCSVSCRCLHGMRESCNKSYNEF